MKQHTLHRPISVSGKKIESLTLHEPTVASLRRLRKITLATDEIDAALAMISALSDVPVKALEQLHALDFAALSDAAAAMLTASAPATPPPQAVPLAVLSGMKSKFN